MDRRILFKTLVKSFTSIEERKWVRICEAAIPLFVVIGSIVLAFEISALSLNENRGLRIAESSSYVLMVLSLFSVFSLYRYSSLMKFERFNMVMLNAFGFLWLYLYTNSLISQV